MYSIGRLAARFGLSRSTLLYYDRIGLLAPSSGGAGAYRYYSEADARRLEQICLYRRAGVRLADIGRALASPGGELARILEARLLELNREAEAVREQQRLIVGLLKNPALLEEQAVMNRRTWTELLAASGFTLEDMHRWHIEFERRDPARHLGFLKFLCIPDEEIEAIRSWSRPDHESGEEAVSKNG